MWRINGVDNTTPDKKKNVKKNKQSQPFDQIGTLAIVCEYTKYEIFFPLSVLRIVSAGLHSSSFFVGLLCDGVHWPLPAKKK